jgi:hypothetical protein
MRSVVVSMSPSYGQNLCAWNTPGSLVKPFSGTIGETRIRGSIGVRAPNSPCGSCRLEPKDSQLEGARSIEVGLVAASAGVANSAGSKIVVRPFIKIVLALTTNSEELACCARQ